MNGLVLFLAAEGLLTSALHLVRHGNENVLIIRVEVDALNIAVHDLAVRVSGEIKDLGLNIREFRELRVEMAVFEVSEVGNPHL